MLSKEEIEKTVATWMHDVRYSSTKHEALEDLATVRGMLLMASWAGLLTQDEAYQLSQPVAELHHEISSKPWRKAY